MHAKDRVSDFSGWRVTNQSAPETPLKGTHTAALPAHLTSRVPLRPAMTLTCSRHDSLKTWKWRRRALIAALRLDVNCEGKIISKQSASSTAKCTTIAGCDN